MSEIAATILTTMALTLAAVFGGGVRVGWILRGKPRTPAVRGAALRDVREVSLG